MGLISKASWVGIGYVLGARAGTARYDQIVSTTRKIAARPELPASLRPLTDRLAGSMPAAAQADTGPSAARATPPPAGLAASVHPPGPAAARLDPGTPTLAAAPGRTRRDPRPARR